MRRAVFLFAVALTGVTLLQVALPLAYVHTVRGSWPSGSVVPLYLQLGTPDRLLIDGATSWNDIAATAAATWDRHLTSIDLVTRVENRARLSNDGINDVFFADDFYGDAFAPEVLALTTHWWRGENRVEGDVVFNRAKSWDSYRGAARSGAVDFRRVALHAFGHLLGLTHPDANGQSVPAVMNSSSHGTGGEHDDLQDDDIRGVRALYGGPPQPARPPPASLPRAEAIDYWHRMEAWARGRFPSLHETTFVDIDAVAIWTSEYFWYRLSYCDHETATARVFAQIEGLGVQPLCAQPASAGLFPSNQDAERFREALETEFRDVLRRPANVYHLGRSSDVVFLRLYLSYRWVTGLSHPAAFDQVMAVLEPPSPTPAPTPTPAPAPPPSPSPAPLPPAPAAGRYDGTYDFSWTHPAPGGQTTRVFPRFVIVTNGRVRSTDGLLTGAVTNDNFGNVEFTGPCWDGSSGGATFTGILNAGSGPKFGQGTVACRNVNAPGGTWRVYNGN